MGLFDNLFNGFVTTSELTPAGAYLGVLIGACACDGHIAEQEIDRVRTITGAMQLFAEVDDAEWNRMMETIEKIINKEDVSGLIAKCMTTLPDELRPTVFANAADLVLADGVVEEEEKEFLESLQAALDLDADTALTIAEVMLIKNKG